MRAIIDLFKKGIRCQPLVVTGLCFVCSPLVVLELYTYNVSESCALLEDLETCIEAI